MEVDKRNCAIPNRRNGGEKPWRGIGSIGFANLPKGWRKTAVGDRYNWALSNLPKDAEKRSWG